MKIRIIGLLLAAFATTMGAQNAFSSGMDGWNIKTGRQINDLNGGSPSAFGGIAQWQDPKVIESDDESPVITSLEPTRVIVNGGAVTLIVKGSGFTSRSTVKLNGQTRPVRYIDSSELRLEIPRSILNRAAEIWVVVHNSDGEFSNAVLFTVENPVPIITDITPTSKYVGDGPFTLFVSGRDFVGESAVRFNGADQPTRFIDTATLSVEVSSSQLASAGEISIRVFTPAPGGGVSGALTFLVLGASMSGTVYEDRNGNGLRDEGEQGLFGWIVRIIRNGAQAESVLTDRLGGYAFPNLIRGTYQARVSLPQEWTQSQPEPPGVYTFEVAGSLHVHGKDFGFFKTDTSRYRTFAQGSLIGVSAVKPRPYASKFTFEFNNLTQLRANGLHVEFNSAITSFIMIDSFTAVRAVSQLNRNFDFTGAAIEASQAVKIVGIGPRNGMRVKKWWWTYDGTTISTKNESLLPVKQEFLLPMPNAANFRNEVFFRMAYQPATSNASSRGIVVGIPQNHDGNPFGWVILRRSSDVVRSLNSPQGQHVGEARGFDSFTNGRRFVGEQRMLPASKHNNRLFADQAALKLNISASELQVTPIGLGELLFEEDGNPLSGMMVREIAAYADTVLTYWIGRSPAEYRNLDSTIRKINGAFSGPVDTISFGSLLRLAGVRGVSDVPFLHENRNMLPRVLPTTSVVSAELPLAFALQQNYPNPFNPTTTIQFDLAQPSVVTLKVYNVLGQEVMTLLQDESLEDGDHSVEFDGTGLTSGVYLYRIVAVAGSGLESSAEVFFTDTRKMLLLK